MVVLLLVGVCGGIEVGNFVILMMKILWLGRLMGELLFGVVRIGWVNDNDIVIFEVLVLCYYVILVLMFGGMEIWDNCSINGIFVNGVWVDVVLLYDGDVVIIGNIDFVFVDGILVCCEENLLEICVGGFDVCGVIWIIDGDKILLDGILLMVCFGMFIVVIGLLGVGKLIFVWLVVGYMYLMDGMVMFEGYNVYVEYVLLCSRIGMVL